MPIELSPQDREILEQHANRKIKPALLGLAEGLTIERIAEQTGMTKGELLGLFNSFTVRGLAGLDLAPPTRTAKEEKRLTRFPTINVKVHRTTSPDAPRGGISS